MSTRFTIMFQAWIQRHPNLAHGLVTATLIEKAYLLNEFQPFIVYGPPGFGKTSYAIWVLNDVYKLWGLDERRRAVPLLDGGWDAVIEKLSSLVFFHPNDFTERCMEQHNHKERGKVIVWDDAGVWLFSLDFFKEEVKMATKYFAVGRSDWASIIFTTYSPDWIVSKIRKIPHSIKLHIIKTGGESNETERNRRANAYRYWVPPDESKGGVHSLYVDDFNCILPNPVYEWYTPKRSQYVDILLEKMHEFASKLPKSGRELDKSERPELELLEG